MRSSEVASIANVSVRTLRHYHDLGLLPEPPRKENGYRDYGASDLARLLHIKRLSSLGFSLAAIKDLLDANEHGSGTPELQALDALDRELELQIQDLEEKRRIVAMLKREDLDPALPVDFARAMKRLFGQASERSSQEAALSDRAALVIAGQFYDEASLEELKRIIERLEERDLMNELREVQRQSNELAPDASEEERATLVIDGMAIIEVILDCIDESNWEGEDNDTLEWLTEMLTQETLNAAQQDVTQRLNRAIEKRIRGDLDKE